MDNQIQIIMALYKNKRPVSCFNTKSRQVARLVDLCGGLVTSPIEEELYRRRLISEYDSLKRDRAKEINKSIDRCRQL